MKRSFFFVIFNILTLSPALAGSWHFTGDTEGGAEYYIFYNESGTLLDNPRDKNQILVNKQPEGQDLKEDGGCSFDNCRVSVRINGRGAEPQEPIHILFSNGFELNFKQGQNGGEEIMSNFTTHSMGATNYFDDYLRSEDWVEISFGQDSYRFDLTGSKQAANQVIGYPIFE